MKLGHRASLSPSLFGTFSLRVYFSREIIPMVKTRHFDTGTSRFAMERRRASCKVSGPIVPVGSKRSPCRGTSLLPRRSERNATLMLTGLPCALPLFTTAN
ncbi:hypothetical protein FIBSPDRAFT_553710 [Athelia psychrophila]|uniref:Uncharacterized protein n=1 Tax=Athelia psychrophila TaxID=1759441 RepID=A0A166ILR0_9AGAM|nr:hypothetical protein FIBSPDRAFT_553710 [Fibularhizoctonia sp. CBS 109695]